MLSDEQKVAKQMVSLINKLDLDLEMVGKQIAQIQPKTFYNRFVLVAEAAVDEMEKTNEFDTLQY